MFAHLLSMTVIWSSYTVKYIEAIETVQRRFTKWLHKFSALPYTERLKRLNLLSLELRRLHADLICCYKILFGLTDLQASKFFVKAPLPTTRDHNYKLYKKHFSVTVRTKFLGERIVSVRNNFKTLLILVLSLASFAPSKLDLSEHIGYC